MFVRGGVPVDDDYLYIVLWHSTKKYLKTRRFLIAQAKKWVFTLLCLTIEWNTVITDNNQLIFVSTYVTPDCNTVL